MSKRKFIKAILMQYSGIVGAGIFILPYLFFYSNFYFVSFWLIVIALFMMALDQLYIDIIVNTKGDHQLAGYARIYLGRFFEFLASANMIVLGLGATSAFIRLGSDFIKLLLPGSPPLVYQLIFLSFFGIFHTSNFPLIKKMYHYIPLISISIILILFSFSLKIPFSILKFPSPNYSFLGGLIFAMTGFVIVPEVERYINSHKNKPKNKVKNRQIIIWANRGGIVLAALTYFIFAISIMLLSNSHLSSDTISGLLTTHPKLGLAVAILGIALTFKACLNFAMCLQKLLSHDYNLSENKSLLISLLIPFSTLFLNKFSFMQIISVTGTFTIATSAFIIVCVKLSQWKTKLKKSKKSSILST